MVFWTWWEPESVLTVMASNCTELSPPSKLRLVFFILVSPYKPGAGIRRAGDGTQELTQVRQVLYHRAKSLSSGELLTEEGHQAGRPGIWVTSYLLLTAWATEPHNFALAGTLLTKQKCDSYIFSVKNFLAQLGDPSENLFLQYCEVHSSREEEGGWFCPRPFSVRAQCHTAHVRTCWTSEVFGVWF